MESVQFFIGVTCNNYIQTDAAAMLHQFVW